MSLLREEVPVHYKASVFYSDLMRFMFRNDASGW
jgi:hypothetical protein